MTLITLQGLKLDIYDDIQELLYSCTNSQLCKHIYQFDLGILIVRVGKRDKRCSDNAWLN